MSVGLITIFEIIKHNPTTLHGLEMRIILIIVYILLLSCDHIASEKEAIRSMINDLIAVDNRSDLESVLSHYAPDATLMPPGKPSISGLEKIRENYKNIFATTRLELATQIEDVEVNRFSALAWGYNTGKAISLKDSSVRTINDKYVAHLIKEKGKWKIQRLIWNAE